MNISYKLCSVVLLTNEKRNKKEIEIEIDDDEIWFYFCYCRDDSIDIVLQIYII